MLYVHCSTQYNQRQKHILNENTSTTYYGMNTIRFIHIQFSENIGRKIIPNCCKLCALFIFLKLLKEENSLQCDPHTSMRTR